MKQATFLFLSILLVTLCAASPGNAASTTIGGSIAWGEDDSMAYALGVKQRYDPWIASEIFEIAPLAEIGGHAWVSNHTGVDTVWGGFLAPGLRFTLNTGKNFQPFLEASVGGALNSASTFDDRQLGSSVLLRTRGSVGVALGPGGQHRIQGDYTNYSTGGLTRKNDGYNTYGISYGFSF